MQNIVDLAIACIFVKDLYIALTAMFVTLWYSFKYLLSLNLTRLEHRSKSISAQVCRIIIVHI